MLAVTLWVAVRMRFSVTALVLIFFGPCTDAFGVSRNWLPLRIAHATARKGGCAIRMDVVSPFDTTQQEQRVSAPQTGPLPLTFENVELVLDEMRPYLMADGGNVAVRDIDGGTVILELQGACGTCPSSSMTMKMGLERGLLEKIPEIISVEQVAAEGVEMTEDTIEEVLGEIRPFLKMAGGDVTLLSVDAGDLQPSCTLRLTGSGSTLRSIKAEIIQRLRDKMPSMAGVLWEE